MRIDLSFSESEHSLPYFKELSDYVSSILTKIPDLVDVFVCSMEEAHVKEKAQKACSEGVCKSRRNKAVSK